MDCKTAASLLEAYLDGELDRELARELEAHVDTCADCQAALAGLDRIRRAIRAEAPRYAAPAELRERIRQSPADARTCTATPSPSMAHGGRIRDGVSRRRRRRDIVDACART